jgi:hypothetical protein
MIRPGFMEATGASGFVWNNFVHQQPEVRPEIATDDVKKLCGRQDMAASN